MNTLPTDSFLRMAKSWFLLPVAAWVVSIPCLGAGAFFLPIVIWQAPLGILGYFQEITVNPTPEQVTAIAIIHGFFWVLFFTGFAVRKTLRLKWLRMIWFSIAAALFMSVSGCATQLGPGLRNEGNWH